MSSSHRINNITCIRRTFYRKIRNVRCHLIIYSFIHQVFEKACMEILYFLIIFFILYLFSSFISGIFSLAYSFNCENTIFARSNELFCISLKLP